MSEELVMLALLETSVSSTSNSISRAGRASGEVHMTTSLLSNLSISGTCKVGKTFGHSTKKTTMVWITKAEIKSVGVDTAVLFVIEP